MTKPVTGSHLDQGMDGFYRRRWLRTALVWLMCVGIGIALCLKVSRLESELALGGSNAASCFYKEKNEFDAVLPQLLKRYAEVGDFSCRPTAKLEQCGFYKVDVRKHTVVWWYFVNPTVEVECIVFGGGFDNREMLHVLEQMPRRKEITRLAEPGWYRVVVFDN